MATAGDGRRALLEEANLDRRQLEAGADPAGVALSPADADLAEDVLRAHLAAQPKAPLSRAYDRYLRQVVGLTKGGARLAWVNAFCDEGRRAQLATEVVRVKDGGDCYFNALVDLAARRVLWLNVNGEA
jgi:hypothetical protein